MLVTKRIVGIEVSRRLRLFLANRLIALGWGLKGFCTPCAQRLFTSARWLVPEAQRFLIQRTVSHNRNRRTFGFAVALRTLLRGIPPRVVAGLLIVLAFLGSLDLAMRATAISAQPLAENSAFQHESQTPSENKVFSVSKQSELVPMPTKKPEEVYKVPNGKGAKANPASQKRVAQQKRAKPKPMR